MTQGQLPSQHLVSIVQGWDEVCNAIGFGFWLEEVKEREFKEGKTQSKFETYLLCSCGHQDSLAPG